MNPYAWRHWSLVKSLLLIMCIVLIQFLGNKSLATIIIIIIIMIHFERKKNNRLLFLIIGKEETIIGPAKRIIGNFFGNKIIE